MAMSTRTIYTVEVVKSQVEKLGFIKGHTWPIYNGHIKCILKGAAMESVHALSVGSPPTTTSLRICNPERQSAILSP